MLLPVESFAVVSLWPLVLLARVVLRRDSSSAKHPAASTDSDDECWCHVCARHTGVCSTSTNSNPLVVKRWPSDTFEFSNRPMNHVRYALVYSAGRAHANVSYPLNEYILSGLGVTSWSVLLHDESAVDYAAHRPHVRCRLDRWRSVWKTNPNQKATINLCEGERIGLLPESVGFLMVIFAGYLEDRMRARRVGIERTFAMMPPYETFIDHCPECLQISQHCLRYTNDIDVMFAIFTNE